MNAQSINRSSKRDYLRNCRLTQEKEYSFGEGAESVHARRVRSPELHLSRFGSKAQSQIPARENRIRLSVWEN